MREPSGYFDLGFPQAIGVSNNGLGHGIGASGLANEIMKDSTEGGGFDWCLEQEVGEKKSSASSVSFEADEEAVDSSSAELELSGERGEERARRHSSTTVSSWQAHPIGGDSN